MTTGKPPFAGFEVLLITGMSGAGRTRAADSMEDMGWYVVDNMPPRLLVPLVDMMTSAGSSLHRLAAVIDVRSRSYFDDLSAGSAIWTTWACVAASSFWMPPTRCWSSATSPFADPTHYRAPAV